MKKIADIAAYLFILAVVILSAISILGVWDFFSGDVILKSFQSIGLLAVVAIIILIAERFIDKGPANVPEQTPTSTVAVPESHIIFKGIRGFTLALLILSVALLALLGIMAIWEMVSGEVLNKSLASMAIIGFSSLVIVMTCLERENNPILARKGLSAGTIIFIIIMAWIFLASIF